jgi:hypothetical protein
MLAAERQRLQHAKLRAELADIQADLDLIEASTEEKRSRIAALRAGKTPAEAEPSEKGTP